MKLLARYLPSLRAVDILIIVFINFLSLLGIVMLPAAQVSALIIFLNIVVMLLVAWLAVLSEKRAGGALQAVHNWYPVPMIFFIFKEVHFIIQFSGRRDWDNLLIAIDRAIFGVNPTVWLSRIQSPLL